MTSSQTLMVSSKCPAACSLHQQQQQQRTMQCPLPAPAATNMPSPMHQPGSCCSAIELARVVLPPRGRTHLPACRQLMAHELSTGWRVCAATFLPSTPPSKHTQRVECLFHAAADAAERLRSQYGASSSGRGGSSGSSRAYHYNVNTDWTHYEAGSSGYTSTLSECLGP